MKKLKRIGVAGAGNVGSGLVLELARHDLAEQVVVASRNLGHAKAAILDAGSVFPSAASTFESAAKLEGQFDLVIITAGDMPHGPTTVDELLDSNFKIAIDALSKVDSPIIVVIGTPVDRLTEKLAYEAAFKGKQVIGFGGQLDVARMQYALLSAGKKMADPGYVIGEHGPRTIPVYEGESEYDQIREATTSVLKRIAVATEKPRNMATGVQLAVLARALSGEERILCVSAVDDATDGLSITWPYLVNKKGLVKKVSIDALGPRVKRDLTDLLKIREEEQRA